MFVGPYRFSDPVHGLRYEWLREGKHARLYILGEKPEDRKLVRMDGDPHNRPSTCFEPQTLEVLGCFLHHGNVQISREILEKEAWTDKVIDETTLPRYVSNIRLLLLDEPVEVPRDRRHPDGKTYRTIATIKGFGYEFLLTVEAATDATLTPAGDQGADHEPLDTGEHLLISRFESEKEAISY